uniref:Uncharacterized protein n=1 Tax=Zea mays TaxID=4577 RepID=B4FZT2_MAIZE|nr:unknown [Zea mays]
MSSPGTREIIQDHHAWAYSIYICIARARVRLCTNTSQD